jgi:3-oxoacyl-[acyl-carrier protein] reductase
MDLGLSGKRAIVCAASKGLGRGCAQSLAREGAHVVISARNEGPLQETAEAIRRAGGKATAVVGDVTTEAGRARLLEACPEPDILVNNAGGPPPGNFRNWGREDWIKAVDANMVTPILFIKAVVDGMIARRYGRIVNITSTSVKAPIPILGLSNGARAGLTGFVAGLARETVRHNVTINNLLPGPFDTDRLRATIEATAKASGESLEAARAQRMAGNPAQRFGTPEEFGDMCAYLCSAQAGFITGQNVVLDGGAYPGTL